MDISKGKAVQIISVHDVHQFELNEEALKSILFNERLKNKKIVVVSIAGAFRKGKSFLLNLFLKYLQEKGKKDWLVSGDYDKLSGFAWRGGSERETTGILMWSEPFYVSIPHSNGQEKSEEVAILLMDTQGAFDSQSTVKDCATVFALSTMLCSVQIYNLIQNIQEDDLQHLQLFTEYGRLASEDYSNKPFQHLMFLIRDWSYPYEYPYGLNGGNQLLDKRLEIKDSQHPELQQIRKHIKTCFSQLDCFLLPHPGLNVATSPNFVGNISEIQSDFLENIKVLAPLIFAPENLVLKEINGVQITAHDLFLYFQAYIKIYQGNELPEPKTMLLATAEANNLTALSASKDRYTHLMDEICGPDRPYTNPGMIDKEHAIAKRKALILFRSTKKMGGPQFCQGYEERLVHEIAEHYEAYVKTNEAKNVFSAGRTPIVLICSMIICYIISNILSLVGLTGLAKLWSYSLGICLILLVVWLYARIYASSSEVYRATPSKFYVDTPTTSTSDLNHGLGGQEQYRESPTSIDGEQLENKTLPFNIGDVADGIDSMAKYVWETVLCEWFSAVLQHPTVNSTLGNFNATAISHTLGLGNSNQHSSSLSLGGTTKTRSQTKIPATKKQTSTSTLSTSKNDTHVGSNHIPKTKTSRNHVTKND